VAGTVCADTADEMSSTTIIQGDRRMKVTAGKHDERRGAALFVTMMVVFMISSLLATMATISMQRTHVVDRLADRIRATANAEAGASEAFSILAVDFSQRMNAAMFPEKSYGNGTYDATVTPVGSDMAVISCVGICGSVEVVVVLDIKDYGGGGGGGGEFPTFDTNAFGYAMICGSTFTFRGCGDITNGVEQQTKIHSNGAMSINGNAKTGVDISSSVSISIGNNKDIYGDVTSPILNYTPSKVDFFGGGPHVEAVPLVTIPDIDLTPYATWADANGEYIDGDWSMSGGEYTPNGGVLYVNGTVHISGHAVFNGSIIANGNVHFSGGNGGRLNPSEYGIGIASRDGNINITSSGILKGLFYAKTGSYDHTANGTVEGQVIANGYIDKGGNSDVVLFQQYIPTYPGDERGEGGDEGTPNIGVSAWQK
jgi:hypothetical protein